MKAVSHMGYEFVRSPTLNGEQPHRITLTRWELVDREVSGGERRLASGDDAESALAVGSGVTLYQDKFRSTNLRARCANSIDRPSHASISRWVGHPRPMLNE